jgi:hypothetical protein
MCGKRVAQTVAVGPLYNASRVHSSFQRALQYSFGDVVPLFPGRARIVGETRRRKNILPRPLTRCIGKLPREREREVDTAKSVFEILLVLCFDSG